VKTLSILGSGWLGLPLAKELKSKYDIKLSTTSTMKLQQLEKKGFKSYLIDLENIKDSIKEFLESEVLIVNIPSKNIKAFQKLLDEVTTSSIKKVIFTSSTSVYKECNERIKEEEQYLKDIPLKNIEDLFLDLEDKEVTILRFGGLIGYDRNLLKHFQTKVVPNSKAVVNLIHRDDCIGIIKKVLETSIEGVFNCCASSHPTKEKFYTYLSTISEYKLPQFDKQLNTSKIIDNQKLKEKLDYTFIYDELLKVEFSKEEI